MAWVLLFCEQKLNTTNNYSGFQITKPRAGLCNIVGANALVAPTAGILCPYNNLWFTPQKSAVTRKSLKHK